MSYTNEQEIFLEGAVSDFDKSIASGNYQEALSIIAELKGLDYEEPANRLPIELARKRMNHED